MNSSTETYGESLIEKAYREMMAVEMKAREVELYAAWRAGYDYLYVVSTYSMPPKRTFIPSDDPDLGWEEFHTEQYDLREQQLSPAAREILRRFEP